MSAPSGGPLIQHSLQVMLEFFHQGKISLEKIVEKMCHAPAILFEIKDRGYLICGVSEPRPGFADIDDKSNWNGFDVDMCRAVAAAIFSDSTKVEFKLTTNKSRFPMLAGNDVDMLSRITTWTFDNEREPASLAYTVLYSGLLVSYHNECR